MNAKPKPRTLADIFFQVVDRNQPRVMLFERDSVWHAISSSDLYRRVMGVVQALRAARHFARRPRRDPSRKPPGVGDCRLCHTHRGAATVPIYATLTAEQISFLLRHSGAKTAFVSTAAQLAKLRSIQSETFVETIILMDEPTPDAEARFHVRSHGSRPQAAHAGTRCPRQRQSPQTISPR